jgi:hypothetical protein
MQPAMYELFHFKINTKNKANSYMPCEAMTHSTKLHYVNSMKTYKTQSITFCVYKSFTYMNIYIYIYIFKTIE